jgi:hypothetical protein
LTSDDDKPLTPAQARQKFQKGLMDYLAGNDTGPIGFRLKRTKKASETYPLKLTHLQRETLLRCTELSRNLKKKIKHAGMAHRSSPSPGTNSTSSTRRPAKPPCTHGTPTLNA